MKKLLAALGVTAGDLVFEEVDRRFALTKPLTNSTDIFRIAAFTIGAVDYVTGILSRGGEIGEALILSTMPLLGHTVKNAVAHYTRKPFRGTVATPPPPKPATVVVAPQPAPQLAPAGQPIDEELKKRLVATAVY